MTDSGTTITIGGPVSGPVNATTDDGGKRTYVWQGRKLLSVTSAPRAAGLARGLHRWFIGNLIDHVIRNASAISLRASTGDEREIKVLRAQLWAATDGDGQRRVVGIAVHRAAAEGHDPEQVHPEIAPFLRQYLDWLERTGAEVLGAEFQVWNLTEGVAGTVDLMVRFRDGTIAIIDLKTGESLYAEMALQLTAYLMAEFVGANDTVDEAMTAHLHAVSRLGILHLSASGWEYVALSIPKLSAAWTAYRALLRYVSWLAEFEKLEPLIEARRRSDGVVMPSAGEPLSGLGWSWAQIGTNLPHLVPPNGDMAICMRAVERGRRVELEAQPERVCLKCLGFVQAGERSAAA